METTTFQVICNELRQCLEEEKNRITAAMRNYPTPVSGCDAQYNYLFTQRNKLFSDLSRVDSVCKSKTPNFETIQMIDALIQSSSFIGAETVKHIRAKIDALEVS